LKRGFCFRAVAAKKRRETCGKGDSEQSFRGSREALNATIKVEFTVSEKGKKNARWDVRPGAEHLKSHRLLWRGVRGCRLGRPRRETKEGRHAQQVRNGRRRPGHIKSQENGGNVSENRQPHDRRMQFVNLRRLPERPDNQK